MRLNRLKIILLIAGDILLLYAALYLTLLLRFQTVDYELWLTHFMPFSVLFGVWIVVFYVNGLYDISTSKNDIGFYNKILKNLLINFALAAAYFYLLTDRLFDIKPRAVYFIFIGIAGLSFSLWRYWYNSFVQRPGFLKNVLVIGMKDEARELIEEIISKPQLGYRIKAIIINNRSADYKFPGVEILDGSQNLKKILKQNHISTVVSALNHHTDPELAQNLYESLALKIQFFDLATFYETLTGKIPITTIGHIWFLENLAEAEKGVYELSKRILDIAISILVLLATLPFVPLIVLAIKLDSKGPALFRQVRVGFLGRPFTAYKFRSMVVGAEKDGEPQWARIDDARVTRVGRIMRKLRLDEIPQFINILKNEMSLIGPRPERPEFVKNLHRDIPFYDERHLVKPGLTGWAQINFQYGASTKDSYKKLQYDLFYVKNRSVPLDLGIVLKTINIMLSGKGR